MLLDVLTPADVRAGARLLQRLTDRQWQDAFRAANYAEPGAERFSRRIKRKIADGLALRAETAVTDTSNAKNRDARR